MNQKHCKALALRLRQKMPRYDDPAFRGWLSAVEAVRDCVIPTGHLEMFDELSGWFVASRKIEDLIAGGR